MAFSLELCTHDEFLGLLIFCHPSIFFHFSSPGSRGLERIPIFHHTEEKCQSSVQILVILCFKKDDYLCHSHWMMTCSDSQTHFSSSCLVFWNQATVKTLISRLQDRPCEKSMDDIMVAISVFYTVYGYRMQRAEVKQRSDKTIKNVHLSHCLCFSCGFIDLKYFFRHLPTLCELCCSGPLFNQSAFNVHTASSPSGYVVSTL